ncbi:DUF2115 family protein [uncultured Methanobacterium sp.]|uniref:DUF2115 family protein n=1 Tax=uncultured Methanobacterium sp. TaxID=176306 RepID=UPI002AA9226A|nr:DUF2115 family protein [uncultured Methanobacterium sp.]
MKTSLLFQKIKGNLKGYEKKVKTSHDQGPPHTADIHATMSRYNWDNFQEIMNSLPEDYTGEVDVEKVKDIETRIDHYFQLYGAGDDEFKEFIKGISIYLALIAGKPLHPPGIVFSNKTTVYERKGVYYCTGKKIFIEEELSLCKYCICHSSPANSSE